MKGLLIAALAALTVAAASGTAAPTAGATDGVGCRPGLPLCTVGLLTCAFSGGGEATVPAGVPIHLRNVGESAGNYGLLQDFLLKQTTTDTILRNGTTTVVDLTNSWLPQQLDHGWVAFPPDTELGTLSSGESVLVTWTQVFSGPVLYAVQPVGPSGENGPVFIEGDTLSCLITAA